MTLASDERYQLFPSHYFTANVAGKVAGVWREKIRVLLGRARAEGARISGGQRLNLSAILCRQASLRTG